VEHINAAEELNGFPDRMLGLIRFGDIRGDKSAAFTNDSSYLLARLHVDIDDCDLSSFTGEGESGGSPDPFPATSHNRHLVFELHT
jgi:hypothetical protein